MYTFISIRYHFVKACHNCEYGYCTIQPSDFDSLTVSNEIYIIYRISYNL